MAQPTGKGSRPEPSPCCRRPEGGDARHAESTINAVILESVLTCPHCGIAHRGTMPADACQFYYECPNCGALLRPKPGDCCVFCSFGSMPCPPIQQQRGRRSDDAQ